MVEQEKEIAAFALGSGSPLAPNPILWDAIL
jgi:hypothetical protein